MTVDPAGTEARNSAARSLGAFARAVKPTTITPAAITWRRWPPRGTTPAVMSGWLDVLGVEHTATEDAVTVSVQHWDALAVTLPKLVRDARMLAAYRMGRLR